MSERSDPREWGPVWALPKWGEGRVPLVEIDRSGDKIGGKIRNAEMAKVHTMFVIGQKEQDAGAVAVRVHGKGDVGAKPKTDAIAQIVADIHSRKL